MGAVRYLIVKGNAVRVSRSAGRSIGLVELELAIVGVTVMPMGVRAVPGQFVRGLAVLHNVPAELGITTNTDTSKWIVEPIDRA